MGLFLSFIDFVVTNGISLLVLVVEGASVKGEATKPHKSWEGI